MFALLPTQKSEVLTGFDAYWSLDFYLLFILRTSDCTPRVAMISCKIVVASAVVFVADVVQCFYCHHAPLRRKTSLQVADSDSVGKDENEAASKGGAGSWRAKAKEFLKDDGTKADVSDRKLNIAFVTGNAMKQKEINLILSKYGTTDVN